jgi:hypothetical protein
MSFRAFVKNSANQPLNTSGPVLIRAQYLGLEDFRPPLIPRWCVISEEAFSYQITNGILNLRLGDGGLPHPNLCWKSQVTRSSMAII